MPNDSVAQDIAAEDKRLSELSVLCSILAAGIDHSRRDLRQIRSDAADKVRPDESGLEAPPEIWPQCSKPEGQRLRQL